MPASVRPNSTGKHAIFSVVRQVGVWFPSLLAFQTPYCRSAAASAVTSCLLTFAKIGVGYFSILRRDMSKKR
jgi:hypothetical protein